MTHTNQHILHCGKINKNRGLISKTDHNPSAKVTSDQEECYLGRNSYQIREKKKTLSETEK
jgi:hypothetical protein